MHNSGLNDSVGKGPTCKAMFDSYPRASYGGTELHWVFHRHNASESASAVYTYLPVEGYIFLCMHLSNHAVQKYCITVSPCSTRNSRARAAEDVPRACPGQALLASPPLTEAHLLTYARFYTGGAN